MAGNFINKIKDWMTDEVEEDIIEEEMEGFEEEIDVDDELGTHIANLGQTKSTSKIVNIKSIDEVLPSNVKKEWNEELKQYYVEYNENGKTYKMWIEDETSLRHKIALVNKYNLAGIASWEKDRETQNIWNVIQEVLN